MKQLLPIATLLAICMAAWHPGPCKAQIDRFMPAQECTTEIWRVTHDPSLRHWASYHNNQAWSHDGRYICYVKYEPYDIDPEVTVYVYDLFDDREIEAGPGRSPRWAKAHNWLFYLEPADGKGNRSREGSGLIWLDMDSGERSRIAGGRIRVLGDTDYGDRWIYGSIRTGRREENGFRVPIRENARVELLEGLHGYQWIANPSYPVVFSREHTPRGPWKEIAFAPTRTWCDLEGDHITIGSPMIQRCHQTWSGNGKYLLHGGRGGSLMSGRIWNEPFPSNLHVLSAIQCGDISDCGKSGRWVCGSANRGPMQLADLWSGHGWDYLPAALSYIHDSYLYSYNHGSALHDNDSKGSADGTKIVFVTNYDLKNGPVTETTEEAGPSTDAIRVRSTKGFPPSGALSIHNEVVGYSGTTPTGFVGLTRNMYRTTSRNLDGVSKRMMADYRQRESDEAFIEKYNPSDFEKTRAVMERNPTHVWKGMTVTSFDARLIPAGLRKKKKLPTFFASEEFPGDKDSPLIWQNRTDVHIAVVRLPDQPHLNSTGEGMVELIPGENHRETRGYHLFRDGTRIDTKKLEPGTIMDLDMSGSYTAVAVEWSGLESRESFPLRIEAPALLRIRPDKPADFSWKTEKWLVNGQEVSEEAALYSKTAHREIDHLVDGTIHREWYSWGTIQKRHDLNSDGKAIRRMTYDNGKLAMREYYRDGVDLVSRELFDEEGRYIVEALRFITGNGRPEKQYHFWYREGWPVRFAGSGGWHATNEGPGIYRKEGDKWVKVHSLR